MNGADVLCQTLLAADIDVCFANPGTSEMHFVAALDETPRMRCVLGLFEGVVTGAADGYARMADRPAATLLHTGPGLANGLANLHNARRARSPIVNIVGDHAAAHLTYDAPLTTDIEGLARPMSQWVGRVTSASTVQKDAAAAITASMSGGGQVATLILPADAAWGSSSFVASETAIRHRAEASDFSGVEDAAKAIRSGRRCLLLLGGQALRRGAMADAACIAQASNVTVMAEQSNARSEQGRDSFSPCRIPYDVDAAVTELADFDLVVLIGARAPIAFFKFPGKPHRVTAHNAEILDLAAKATPQETLTALREAMGIAKNAPMPPSDAEIPRVLSGPLSHASIATTVAAVLPEHAIVCDESISASHYYGRAARGAVPHDLLQLTGGAIGIGPSMAVGAAIACPNRPVLSLQADGSALYTIQALWTQARENLNVVTVIISNRRYQSLYGELNNLGRDNPGRNARTMLDLNDPIIDWPALAQGFGVPAIRVHEAEELAKAVQRSYAEGGPHLIEAVTAQ